MADGGAASSLGFKSMSENETPRLREVTALWQERFGEPPPIVADPEMMLRVLSSLQPAGGEDTTH